MQSNFGYYDMFGDLLNPLDKLHGIGGRDETTDKDTVTLGHFRADDEMI